mgnify:CR=1 FL=1
MTTNTIPRNEAKKKIKFPKIQFVIIDEEEVIFVSSSYAASSIFFERKGKELARHLENILNKHGY